MPNYITHALCANDILQELKHESLKIVIEKNPQVYAMGSSGPDFLFYYRTFPWLDQSQNKEVHNIGQVVHVEKVNEFYRNFVNYILEEKDQEVKEIEIAYLAGHLMHYALDTSAHPFVFFHSGEMKGASKYWHYRLESMIDTVMVKQVKKLDLAHIDAVGMVNSTLKVRKILSKIYRDVVNDVYGLDFDLSIYEECYETMPQVVKLLFDPHNLKFSWIQAGEKLAQQEWNFSSHMVIGKIDTEHDVLNLKKLPWNHPSDEQDVSNESFVELYQKAILRGLAILYALSDVLYHQGSKTKLLKVIGNLSYDTGKENAAKMQYYGSIYENN